MKNVMEDVIERLQDRERALVSDNTAHVDVGLGPEGVGYLDAICVRSTATTTLLGSKPEPILFSDMGWRVSIGGQPLQICALRKCGAWKCYSMIHNVRLNQGERLSS